jgi:hypothetical protein
MTVRRVTDNEIRIRIVPTHLRWPEASTTAAWTKLHSCVELNCTGSSAPSTTAVQRSSKNAILVLTGSPTAAPSWAVRR